MISTLKLDLNFDLKLLKICKMSVFQIHLTVSGCTFVRIIRRKLVGAFFFKGGRGELGFDLGLLEGGGFDNRGGGGG